MKEQITFYDLPEMPFSQGYAINNIQSILKSKVTKAGDFTRPGIEGCFLYVETSKGEHQSKSVWLDNGTSLFCVSFDIGEGWNYTETATKEGVILSLE